MKPVWEHEPDQEDGEFFGFAYQILRMSKMGHLCGYLKVPERHPWHGRDCDSIGLDLEVHGGLTYAKVEGDGQWIGFDCAHAGDYIPYLSPSMDPNDRSEYKDIEFVRGELYRLAQQAKEAAE